MVELSYRDRDGQEVLRLKISNGHPPRCNGNHHLVELGLCPFSSRLGRPVSYQESAEEWARCLPPLYQNTDLDVEILFDGYEPAPGRRRGGDS